MSFKSTGYDGFKYVSDKPTEANVRQGQLVAQSWKRCEHGYRLVECDKPHEEVPECFWCRRKSINGQDVVHTDDCANK